MRHTFAAAVVPMVLLGLNGCFTPAETPRCTPEYDWWIVDVRTEPPILVAGSADGLAIEIDILSAEGLDDSLLWWQLYTARGHAAEAPSLGADPIFGKFWSTAFERSEPIDGVVTIRISGPNPIPSDLAPGDYLLGVGAAFVECPRAYFEPVVVEPP